MNNISLTLSAKHTKFILWTLLFLTPIAGMAVDLVAPSLPALSQHLHKTDALIKLVITLYLMGYALGNFITGFLSDAWGRQKILRITLLGFVLASSLPIFLPTLSIVLISRIFQGLLLGSVAVSSRAIFSDILPVEKLTAMGTLIGTMFGLGPVLGPIIGGYLQFYFGWQACFTFFTSVSFVALIAVFFIIPETHLNRHPLHLDTIKKNLSEVFKHKVFMGLVLIMGCAYSLVISFHTLAPFLIETELHGSSVFFGHLAFCLGLMFLASTFISRHLLKKYPTEKLLFIVIYSFFGIAIIGLIISIFEPNNMLLIAIISGLMFYCTGSTFPMSMGKGMSLFRHIAGTATAIMYLINILFTSLISFLLGFINTHSAIPLMWVNTSLLFMAFIFYWFLIKKRTIR